MQTKVPDYQSIERGQNDNESTNNNNTTHDKRVSSYINNLIIPEKFSIL